MELAQTLHGYRDGHRLLESSISIAETDKRQMLILSDLSGASSTEKIDSYITGYPLQSSNYYVLAKTWYADEMERPGCVWTHSILIPFKDLDSFRNISLIIKLFRKPNQNDISFDYSNKIFFDENTSSEIENLSNLKSDELILYKELINVIYSEQNRSVVLVSKFESFFEIFILNFWIKQWPELKQNFSFSTGSLSNRKLFGRNFDFQVTNKENASEFAKPSLNYKLLDRDKIIEKSEYPSWVSLSLGFVLQSANLSSLQSKNYIYKKFQNDRSNYPAYAFFESEINLKITFSDSEKVIFQIKKSILSEKLKNKLYELIFSSHGLLSLETGIYSLEGEIKLLCEIISNKAFNEIPVDILKVDKRLEKILEINRELLIEYLVRISMRNLSSHSYDFFEVLSRDVTLSDLKFILKENFQIGLFIASQNLLLVCNKEIWSKHNSYQFNELLKVTLSNKEIDNVILRDLLFTILDADNDIVADLMFKYYGKSVVIDILKWSTYSEKLPANGWRKLLEDHPRECINWMKETNYCNKNILIFLCNFLDPTSDEVRSIGIDRWASAINLNRHSFSSNEFYTISEFILPLALSFDGYTARELALFAYHYIIDENREDIRSFKAWTYLESILPEVSWYESWDRTVRVKKYMKKKGFI